MRQGGEMWVRPGRPSSEEELREPPMRQPAPDYLLSMSDFQPIELPKEPGKSAKKPGNPVVGFGVLAAIVLFVIWAYATDDEDADGGSSSGDSVTAKVMCEEFLEDRLRAPGTADFSGMGSTTISSTGSSSYRVVGHVDAENGFGANIRTSYTCEITDNGDDSWSLVSLTTS